MLKVLANSRAMTKADEMVAKAKEGSMADWFQDKRWDMEAVVHAMAVRQVHFGFTMQISTIVCVSCEWLGMRIGTWCFAAPVNYSLSFN